VSSVWDSIFSVQCSVFSVQGLGCRVRIEEFLPWISHETPVGVHALVPPLLIPVNLFEGLGFMIQGLYRVNVQGLGFMIQGLYRVNVQGLGFMIQGFYRVDMLEQRFVSRPKLSRLCRAERNIELVHDAEHHSHPGHEVHVPVPRRRRFIRPV
jgi:hypothetical protein